MSQDFFCLPLVEHSTLHLKWRSPILVQEYLLVVVASFPSFQVDFQEYHYLQSLLDVRWETITEIMEFIAEQIPALKGEFKKRLLKGAHKARQGQPKKGGKFVSEPLCESCQVELDVGFFFFFTLDIGEGDQRLCIQKVYQLATNHVGNG